MFIWIEDVIIHAIDVHTSNNSGNNDAATPTQRCAIEAVQRTRHGWRMGALMLLSAHVSVIEWMNQKTRCYAIFTMQLLMTNCCVACVTLLRLWSPSIDPPSLISGIGLIHLRCQCTQPKI